MAFYTSPSIVLSDSGTARTPVMRYRAGSMTFAEALQELRLLYREYAYDAGCCDHIAHCAAQLKALHAMRTGAWGETAAELADLATDAYELPVAAAEELARRSAPFVADRTYPDAYAHGVCVAGDCGGRVPCHWVMRRGADGQWAELATFLKPVGAYEYWHRDPIRKVKVAG